MDTDWADLLPPEQCSFIFGNPPFVGAKTQSQFQREQVRKIANLGKTGGTLDYVCAWYIKAGHYIQGKTGIGFVSTNSITQGEQVAQLWPILLETCDLEIAFAHKSFAWESEAPGKATVTVVIIGLEKKQHARKDKVLFFYEDTKGKPTAQPASAISPYLFDTSQLENSNVVVKETSRPLNGLPKMMIGTQPIDDGQLIFKTDERDEFLKDEPKAARFMKPLIGAHEFLNSRKRYILDLANEPPRVLRKMPHIMERLQKVTQFREKSKRKSTLAIANNPTQFNITAIPETPFLIIPRVSSDNREYIPIGYAKPPAIPTDAVLYIEGENTLCILALLTSAMHMAWMRTVTGRLGNSYRYSMGLVYNTFPLPKSKDIIKVRTPRAGYP